MHVWRGESELSKAYERVAAIAIWDNTILMSSRTKKIKLSIHTYSTHRRNIAGFLIRLWQHLLFIIFFLSSYKWAHIVLYSSAWMIPFICVYEHKHTAIIALWRARIVGSALSALRNINTQWINWNDLFYLLSYIHNFIFFLHFISFFFVNINLFFSIDACFIDLRGEHVRVLNDWTLNGML